MKYCFRLYVAGRTARSQQAIDDLQRICAQALQGEYEVEVVDVLDHPELAEGAKILATPTVVRQLPEPVRKIIGDLSERERVLQGLDLIPRAPGDLVGPPDPSVAPPPARPQEGAP